MPQIPVYEGPQVRTRALNYDQAGADSFGAQQGRTLERIGVGAGNVGEALDRINEREVQTEVFNAEARAQEAYVAWSKEQTSTRLGEAAKGLTKDAADWWGKAGEEFGKDLSPMAQNMLRRSLTRQSIAARQSMGSFENQQAEAALQTSLKATTQASIDSAVTDSSDSNITTQRDKILAAWGQMRGRVNEETWNTLVRGELTRMHEAVFNRLFVENPSQAKLYYEVNQKEIDGKVKDNILGRLKQGMADLEGGTFARAEFATAMKDKGYNDPIPVDQIDSALVAKFEGEPEKLKAARMELDRQVALRNKAQTEFQAGAVEAVFGALNQGQPLATVKRTSAWSNLSAQSQRQIEQNIEDRGYTMVQRTRGELAYQESRSDREHMLWQRGINDARIREQERERETAPSLLFYSQPEVLEKMTREQIITMMPTLGFQNTSKLLNTWQHFQGNQTALANAKIDNDMFKDTLAAAGIEPNPKPNQKEQAALVLRLRNQLELTLGQMQRGQKRELLPAEKQQVMTEIVNAQVLRPSMWSFLGDSRYNRETRITDLKPGQINETAVEVNVFPGRRQTVRLSEIPSDQYRIVEQQLMREGRAPTPQAVAQAWHDYTARQREAQLNQIPR